MLNHTPKQIQTPPATSSKVPNASSAPKVPAARPPTESIPGQHERAENEGMLAPTPDKLEGEGNYTAARRYDAGVAHSVDKGDIERLAKEAAQALDGPEGAKLRAAEQAAKQGHTK